MKKRSASCSGPRSGGRRRAMEIRSELEGVKAAARSPWRIARCRPESRRIGPGAGVLRARGPAGRGLAARRRGTVAGDEASPSERAAARLDAAEPVLRPAASPRFSEIDLDSRRRRRRRATTTRPSRRPSTTCKRRRTRSRACWRRPRAVAAAEKEPTPRTVRATRDLNPDSPGFADLGPRPAGRCRSGRRRCAATRARALASAEARDAERRRLADDCR